MNSLSFAFTFHTDRKSISCDLNPCCSRFTIPGKEIIQSICFLDDHARLPFERIQALHSMISITSKVVLQVHGLESSSTSTPSSGSESERHTSRAVWTVIDSKK